MIMPRNMIGITWQADLLQYRQIGLARCARGELRERDEAIRMSVACLPPLLALRDPVFSVPAHRRPGLYLDAR
jgi:hypothetical protein